MKILLVEDDLEQSEPLATALGYAGHLVDSVADGKNAQWLMTEKDYDLIILDWMLPQISGVDLCRSHRQSGNGTPILLLTAKDTLQDKVIGLDAGADDYLVKPVDIPELLARVRALGRRSPLWRGDTLKMADLILDLGTMTAHKNDRQITLSTKEFQLLEYFLRHPHQVLTREQIETNLWEWDQQPESNAVSTLVRRLRLRLQELGAADWLQTIYGTGYRFQEK